MNDWQTSHETSPYNGSTHKVIYTLGKIENKVDALRETQQEIRLEVKDQSRRVTAIEAELTTIKASAPWWNNDKVWWWIAIVAILLLSPAELQEKLLRAILK